MIKEKKKRHLQMRLIRLMLSLEVKESTRSERLRFSSREKNDGRFW